MGCQRNTMPFYRDGINEDMPFTLLDSLRSHQEQYPLNPISMRHAGYEDSRQTEWSTNTMLERDLTRRDKDRQCVTAILSRNIDVRYLKSLQKIRDRLRSACYSCNRRFCPLIKERMEKHQRGFHSSVKCSVHSKTEPQKCSSLTYPIVTSPSSKHMIHKSEHKLRNERTVQTECLNCQKPETSSSHKNIGSNTVDKIENNNRKCDYFTAPVSFDKLKPDNVSTVATITNRNNILRIDSCNSFQSDESSDKTDCQMDNSNNMPRESTSDALKIEICSDSQSLNVDRNTTSIRKRFYDIDEFYSCKSDSSVSPLNNEMKEITEPCRLRKITYNNNNKQTASCGSATCVAKSSYIVDKSKSIQFENNIFKRSSGLRKNRYKKSIQKEVREWIREIPMYPGLGKEAKEDNYKAIKDFIRNLDTLSKQASNTEYERKVRSEIDTCLNRMPIWYPRDKRDQCNFKCNLINRLFQRIKIINRKLTDKIDDKTWYINRRINKNEVNEMSDCLPSDQISDFNNLLNTAEIKDSIMEWLWSISQRTKNNNQIQTQMSQITDFVIFRIHMALNKSVNSENHELVLKNAILNIINDLPIIINCPKNRILHIKNLAQDLFDRILRVQEKFVSPDEKTNISSNFNCCSKYCGLNYSASDQKQNIVCEVIRKCFEDASINCSNTLIEEAGVIILYFFEMPDLEREYDARNEIINLLLTSTNHSEVQAINIATVLIKKLKNAFSEGKICMNSKTSNKSLKPTTLSVYTSIEDLNPLNYPITSTPKKKPIKKVIPKLNPQEIQYMENVSNLIRSWMDTLPETFSTPEERSFKVTMIYDLAGDIMDEVKLEQLVPGARDDRRKYFKYFVTRWINKLGAFEITEVNLQIEILLDKLQEIPAPVMTQPQHGNRQAMENLKYNINENWKGTFLPKGIDILEDEISIWMNEQPSHLFKNNDQEIRNRKIRDLAQVLENKLSNKRPQSEIARDVAEWLNNIVRQDRKREVGELAENLKRKVIGIPQDQTLAENLKKKLKNEAEFKKAMLEYKMRTKEKFLSNGVNESSNNETVDQDNTMKMFISKFIEHNYDIDDPLARRAFNRLLKTHLQRLNLPSRQEIYDKIGNNKLDIRFPQRQLVRELEYIKLISDWLKNLPIPASYNTLGNRDRIDFVNSLAINIREVEEERENNPDAMDYELYMIVIIGEFLRLLPIPEEHYKSRGFMMGQLLTKIITHREAVAHKMNETFNTTGVNPENIGDFIEEFIRINGDDNIAQDEVKLEAWAIRLIREIKKIVRNIPGSPVLSKSQIFKQLSDVPIPGDETIKLFSLELEYVKEITKWLKNLPLLPIYESESDDRTRKICQLAEKMVELERSKATNPNDLGIDTDFKEYVTKWITELPLYRKHDIVLPIVIQQLLNRMEKVKQKDVASELDFSRSQKLNNTSFHKSAKCKTSLTKCVGEKGSYQSLSNLMIGIIEKWVNKLPLQDNENAGTNTKNDVSRKLFQIVGQLNMDSRVYNDDILYQDMLADEIDIIVDNLPLNVKSNKVNLKTEIVNAIIEAKNYIKEKTAGDAYKLKLANTIDASIPNPVSINQAYDPGFEIYKDRLVTMFILENFDHGNDIVKIKYERLLKKEIDKYFDHAQNRNALPISKDQLYNELFRSLFKVPIPNEASVIEEVEELKTRCEIDVWFEELPIQEACGLNELLELDKMLSTLAKRIHEIETSKSQRDDKFFKEIMKWLVKFPLQPGNENKLNDFAMKLQERLKSTNDQRKCVTYNSKKSKGKHKVKAKGSAEKHKDGQIAGPSDDGKIRLNVTQIRQLPERTPRKKAADEIFKIVQAWCHQLPINAQTCRDNEDSQMLKDNLMTKIIIKIGEFNLQPDIFNNSVLYDELLDEELEKLLSSFPTSHDFQNSKASRKHQLKEAIKSTKHLITEERANHRYKQELNKTVDKVLEKPKNMAPGKEALCDEIRNDIIDNFVQYKYSTDDDESKQGYKMQIKNNVSKFIGNTAKDELMRNPLMKTNQLISELTMISAKCNSNFNDEIEEIRMKKEVTDFIDEIGSPGKSIDKAKVNHLKANLANKLNEIEINGYTPENECKMKKEIEKCLNKLCIKSNPTKIDAFVNKLKNSEMARLVQLTINKENGEHICQEGCRHKCRSEKQSLGTDTANKLSNALSIDFARYVALNSENMSQNFQHKSKDADRFAFESYQQNCDDNNMGNALQNIQNRAVEENPSENEYKRKCPCYRKPKCHKRRPYCMIPMRYFGGYNGYNPFWCRMPGFI